MCIYVDDKILASSNNKRYFYRESAESRCKVEVAFNATDKRTQYWTVDMLKEAFKDFCKRVEKKDAATKKVYIKTGGGACDPPEFTATDEHLLGLLGTRTMGLTSVWDDDFGEFR